MQIKVKDKEVGECTIESYRDLDDSEQYVIKALGMLQLLCMEENKDRNAYRQFIKTLVDVAKDIRAENSGDGGDPLELF